MADEVFESVESGASLTFPAQASSLKKGTYVVLKGRAAKVIDTSTSKTGKHGHAKVHMVAIDIFNGKKYEDICPSTHNMTAPVVKTTQYQLIDIDDEGFCSLMLDDGSTKDDVQLPDDQVGEDIRAAFEDDKDVTVSVLGAMGIEKITSFKEMSS